MVTDMNNNWANRTIWTGDNLEIMRGMNSDSVDLIYLDPPFNSKTDYAAPIGSRAAGAAFKDSWTLTDLDVEWINLIESKHPALHRVIMAAMTKSDKSYLVYMAARILEMRRIMKTTGTIYLHCDPTMSHYLKILMDAIWGRKNKAFRNEIIWCYRGGGVPKYHFARKHQVILRYSKSTTPTFNIDTVRIPYSDESTKRLEYTARSFRPGRIYDTYKPNPKGKHPDDWWLIQPIMPSSKERTGYPTQKPLALLERIINASSNEGDMVLDPFCGCATTCVMADALGRQWAGIDISPKAAELVSQRINDITRIIIHRGDIPKRTDLGRLPPYNSTDNRHKLYGEQEGHCAGCTTHFESRHLEIDHIISRGKGGTDHIENLQLLCGNCNRIKGDRGMEYLISKLQL